MRPIPMRKVLLLGGATSREEAVARACGQFTGIKRLSARSTFMFTEFLGVRGGVTHDLDELNGCRGAASNAAIKAQQCDQYCPKCGRRCVRSPHYPGTAHKCPKCGKWY